ncbi:hypothetical protein BDF22DRAFT_40415 [Syncephalis plumigaleata]|nr:hypothetical protein BDF22DRAFT_40415 [Syncephalis plumigaleata]
MQAYANEGALAAVEWIWKELMEHPGLLPDRISWNTRINAHAKLGSIDSMEKCAHEMTSIYRLPWDAYTQQALLVGYGRANRWDAVDRIRAMLEQREAVWMSTRFNNSNSSNSQSDESTCKSLTSLTVNYDAFTKYAHTISELPSPTAHTYTALMSLQIEQKDYVAASHTLRRMLQAGIQPTQTTVNVILRLHAEQRDLNGALHLLNQLMDSTRSNNGFSMEWRPDAYTASILLNACAQQEAYEEMHSIRQIMITLGVRFTIATLTALALGYAKAGQSKEARHFTTRSREAILNESSSNRPLSETDLVAHDYSSTGVLNTALKARSGSRVAEAVSVCCAVIRALSDAKCPDGAHAIWQDLVASGLPLGADEHNTRLYALGERCDFTALRLCYHERIMALFPRNTNEQMETDHEELLTDIARGPPANVKTFSVIIHCLAKHGKLEWAEQIYQQLLWLAGLSPHCNIFIRKPISMNY